MDGWIGEREGVGGRGIVFAGVHFTSSALYPALTFALLLPALRHTFHLDSETTLWSRRWTLLEYIGGVSLGLSCMQLEKAGRSVRMRAEYKLPIDR